MNNNNRLKMLLNDMYNATDYGCISLSSGQKSFWKLDIMKMLGSSYSIMSLMDIKDNLSQVFAIWSGGVYMLSACNDITRINVVDIKQDKIYLSPDFDKDKEIIIVDDVYTTGNSFLKAKHLIYNQLNIDTYNVLIKVLLNRSGNGYDKVESLFNVQELPICTNVKYIYNG